MMLTKKAQRLRRSRQTRIRIATQGVARLTVNRTNLHIYATVISDDGTKVIATASTAEAEVRLGSAARARAAMPLRHRRRQAHR
jgi:large subunit ribosomal protein L18